MYINELWPKITARRCLPLWGLHPPVSIRMVANSRHAPCNRSRPAASRSIGRWPIQNEDKQSDSDGTDADDGRPRPRFEPRGGPVRSHRHNEGVEREFASAARRQWRRSRSTSRRMYWSHHECSASVKNPHGARFGGRPRSDGCLLSAGSRRSRDLWHRVPSV